MKMLLKKIYMSILYLLPKKMAHKIFYKHNMKKTLNVENPKDLNEKIQWLIINDYGVKEARYTDKYLVKQVLAKEITNPNLIIPKLFSSYDNANEIILDDLPNRFVLKANNGCGNVFVCRNKEEFDLKNAKKNLAKSVKQNFAKKNLEYHYKYIKPKIICEELLDDGSNSLPVDYKFYCFNGKVKCILVCSDRVDENNKKISYYDINWNKLDYELDSYKNDFGCNKPDNLEQMLDIAAELSTNFKFVRVDLYNINGKIYFGELTFTPACGLIKNIKQSALDELGSYLLLK